ncbi:MAG: acyl-CoA thioesterase [Bacteroidia bacterium]|nr:acyl-CoA thioesterase [Bacteroidia bacterium]
MEDNFKEVSYSATTVSELMIPAYANFGGKIHGGIILSLMDKVAYACASKHASNYCVTVSVENVEFIDPIEVGEMVTLYASVNYVGTSSMVVRIKVIAENFLVGTVKHTNTSYFTMVAKDANGKPTKVPGLILESKEEIKRFLEAIKRKELRTTYKKAMQDVRLSLLVDPENKMLENERCLLRL